MQGRLTCTKMSPYQFFPRDTWQQEFSLAKARNLDHIEWVIDNAEDESNPMVRNSEAIIKLIDETGVSVPTACADFFMYRGLNIYLFASRSTTERLMANMHAVGVKYLVVPLLEHNSPRTLEIPKLVSHLTLLQDMAGAHGLKLSLETDLEPESFLRLLDLLGDPDLTVNYDIGNSAGLGFGHHSEIDLLGSRISVVHIKDKNGQGKSVKLGTGLAKIPECLEQIQKSTPARFFTLQAYRDETPPDVFDEQLRWLRTSYQFANS